MHIGLFFDPITTMFYGKGDAIIDTSHEDSTLEYQPSKHVIPLVNCRQILATWSS
ncbi:hypothetical protein BDC45DRAFT_288919 [Circinella umbellata]|nr:hypothetical protein BDC45DRAFT_288919 [Circinella umbellata]